MDSDDIAPQISNSRVSRNRECSSVGRIAAGNAGLIAKQNKLVELKILNLQQKEMELRQVEMEEEREHKIEQQERDREY